MMNPFHNDPTDYIAYIFLMDKTHYSPDAYDQMKMELIKRNFNFDNLNQEFYIRLVIKNLFPGWEKQVRKMFTALIAQRWTFQQPLDYKESWGRLIFRGFHTDVPPKFEQILNQYIKIFESTCGHCGSRKNVESHDDDYWCKKCHLKRLKKMRISKIDRNGFSYFSRTKKHRVLWTEIDNIEWKTDGYDNFAITLNRFSPEDELAKDYDEEDSILLSNESFNFFKLLRNLPAHLLSESQADEINSLCNSLEECIICRRKSVLSKMINKKCLVCGTLTEKLENPTETNLKRFGSRQGIIGHEKKMFRRSLQNNAIFRYRYETDSSFK
ncbi:hypothetical protein [uncultured Chryseobacterium sp.]|uniref:hypothetical protein n=1 Tax=uncultured Chryseobacterium sp. TaxID=259322 RepID=UPI0025FDE499|nr:hypothetical protein [uncultured Chryseobacterium sp.]